MTRRSDARRPQRTHLYHDRGHRSVTAMGWRRHSRRKLWGIVVVCRSAGAVVVCRNMMPGAVSEPTLKRVLPVVVVARTAVRERSIDPSRVEMQTCAHMTAYAGWLLRSTDREWRHVFLAPSVVLVSALLNLMCLLDHMFTFIRMCVHIYICMCPAV